MIQGHLLGLFLLLTHCPPPKRPRPDHYFPDLHHMKYEIEDGTMLDGRSVRFGYNPLEFEGFSWRGYAQMSPIQVRLLRPFITHTVLTVVISTILATEVLMVLCVHS